MDDRRIKKRHIRRRYLICAGSLYDVMTKRTKRTKRLMITISGAPDKNCKVRMMAVYTQYLICLLSRRTKKFLRRRGNQETAKRCGTRLWTDSIYPDSTKTIEATKEAVFDAFRYLINRYVFIPERKKWMIMSQFQTMLKGRRRYNTCGG